MYFPRDLCQVLNHKKIYFYCGKKAEMLYIVPDMDWEVFLIMKMIALFESFKKRSVKIWCAVLVILLCLAAGVFLTLFLIRDMLRENSRFTLTDVRVESAGFWNGKKDLVCEILRIKPGTTNLFSIDAGNMRKRMIAREPSIENIEVIKILPDTLLIRIRERIPIAQVYRSSPLLFIDGSCMLLQASRCMNIARSLPVISGFENVNSYPPGGEVKRFSSAAKLIQLVNRSYPRIRLLHISVKKSDRLVFVVQYSGRRFLVEMPGDNLPRNMRALLTNLELIRRNRRSENKINLMFKNQAVLSR